MIYKSCTDVENSIFFIHNILTFCCSSGSVGNFIVKDKYNGEIIDIDEFLKKREEFRNRFKSGNIDSRCLHCGKLEERDWDENFSLGYVCVAHHTKCSCNCFYCSFAEKKREWNKRKVYNISNAFKNFLKSVPVQENFYVNITGGECSEYPKNELNTIIDETIKNGGFLHFMSSGMFFSREISNVLKKGKGIITFSIDSGTKETYEKIKRVNYYDKVWKNIYKYASESKITNIPAVRIKYIIIPGINDNKFEFDSFVEKCNKIPNSRIEVSLEYNWFNDNKDNNIPEHILTFLEYIRSYENKIDVVYKETAIPFLRKYRSDFKYE